MGTLKQAVDRVTAAKTAIGAAITAKGGTVAAGDGLEEFADDIATIPTGGGISAPKRSPILNQKYTNNWSAITWIGLAKPKGIRTDGTDIYSSSGSDQYVLNKSTHTWSAITWTGLTDFYGYNIWTDGTDIYYSSYLNHYILDKTMHTWSAITWTGLTDFYGSDIWTDGTDIYYSPIVNPSHSSKFLDKDNAILLSVKPYIE